tara:strand:+ start:666 stop:1331 length:666 start_codon:yes stop_codon:yes gene_type:complete
MASTFFTAAVAQKIVQSIASNKATTNSFFRAAHKIYKFLKLKRVNCIIINDHARKKARFNLGEKYQVLDLEAVYQSMLPDSEISHYCRLKISNHRVWILSILSAFKTILNAVRWSFPKQRIVLLLSNIELAQKLNIPSKSISFYMSDDLLFNELKSKVHGDTADHFCKIRNMHYKFNSSEYSSIEQLQRMINKEFGGKSESCSFKRSENPKNGELEFKIDE